jgi:hypothetical protein
MNVLQVSTQYAIGYEVLHYVEVRVAKLSLCLTKHYSMKTYGGVDVQIHVFLTSAQVGDGQLQAPAAFPPGKEPPVPIG